jgi:hypothetical protein
MKGPASAGPFTPGVVAGARIIGLKGEGDLKHLWHRRSLLGLLLALGLAAAACVSQGSPPTTTRPPLVPATSSPGGGTGTAVGASPTGKAYGGEAIIGQDQEPPTLNSFAPGGDNFIVSLLGQAYWTGVFDIDGLLDRRVRHRWLHPRVHP